MIHPKIAATDAEIARLNDSLTKLKNRRKLTIVELVSEAFPDHQFNPFELIEGHWTCPDDEGSGGQGDPKSPTGKCIYDADDDHCIFCGLPDERK